MRTHSIALATILLFALPARAEPGRPFRFALQIPGPNPIVCCGTKGAWDESVIEACDVVKDFETYYLYYHGVATDRKRWGPGDYRIGLASAPHPLGPWTKVGQRPVLDLGPPGSWDDSNVACAAVLKEAPGKFLMWYSGRSRDDAQRSKGPNMMAIWHVGIARADRPEGPWTKSAQNPILRDFGYVGGVVKGDKYFLYAAHPINSTAPDYAPIVLATADTPDGPWTRRKGDPVLAAGPRGAWDDGGYSEAKVLLWEGTFHAFYGGAKQYLPRIQTRESIGYAWSGDGVNFRRDPCNPVAARQSNPNAAAFAEVHALLEPPLVYAYHTLRWVDPRQASKAAGRTSVLEDLGVQVLVMPGPFSIPMPVLQRERLSPGASTNLNDCPPVALTGVRRATLTLACDYAASAQVPLRISVATSPDGLGYDTDDLTWNGDLRRGARAQKSFDLPLAGRFLRVILENPDRQAECRNVRVVVTLHGG